MRAVTDSFTLTREQLLDISRDFRLKVLEGLSEDGREIKCIPTFVPVSRSIRDGEAYVLDLGGSNLRAAMVAFDGGKPRFLKGPVKEAMPWERNRAITKEEYLSVQAGLINSLGYDARRPLGYCFSYPAEPGIDGDARLIRWTKGVDVRETEGECVGRMLLDYLSRTHKGAADEKVRVINDTVASLLAGLSGPEAGGYIGLVAGTGTNMATFVDSAHMPKLRRKTTWQGPIAINLESGNFRPPYLTEWDEEVDQNSENPGEQRHEKAVSGLYLGRILKTALPGSDFVPESGAEGLVRLAANTGSTDSELVLVARQIYARSAVLTAGALAGLILLLHEQRPRKTIRIVAEGALFWSEISHDLRYCDVVEGTLRSLLEGLCAVPPVVEFRRIEEANLIGSAIAALL
jgi:hexokinase